MCQMRSVQFQTRRVIPSLLILLLFLTGCAGLVSKQTSPPTPTMVPGESLDLIPLGPPEESWTQHCSPREDVQLATTPNEYEQLRALFSAKTAPAANELMGIDFGREAIVGVQTNCVALCKGRPEIEQVILTAPRALTVYAEWPERPPGSACPADAPSFYHLVRIPWDGTPTSATELNLVLYPVYI